MKAKNSLRTALPDHISSASERDVDADLPKPNRIHSGSVCLVLGGGLILIGLVFLLVFLKRVEQYETVTASQLLRELVLPHMILLLGGGLVTTSVILFTRRSVIRKRQTDKAL